MLRIVVQPAAGQALDGLRRRQERRIRRRHRNDLVAVDAHCNPEARGDERSEEHDAGETGGEDRALANHPFGAQLEGRARRASINMATLTIPGNERERVQQREERSRVRNALVAVELERHAEQQIAERDAEHERGHQAVDEYPPVPRVAPPRIGDLASVVEPDRAAGRARTA
jgi:hypothetical protein